MNNYIDINKEDFTDMDWEKMASSLSEDNGNQQKMTDKVLSEADYRIVNHWKELGKMNDEKEIDVDKAWDTLYSRLNESGSFNKEVRLHGRFMRSTFLKIAAAAVILLGIGSVVTYLGSSGTLSRKITVVTGNDQNTERITLADGSVVSLNRNTELSYRSSFGKQSRNVSLSGEAFFEISHDAGKPFIIDAGKASIKVIGTSFNVITQNSDSAVEVFVSTGTVMLSDNSGTRELVLEPGYVGTMNSGLSGKKLNSNPNYMAWNTGRLVYNGQPLSVVFRDLEKACNMSIVADDPAILNDTWTSTIENQSEDTIIRLICVSFNLRYSKDGNVFHLARK
jgi:transmembrane sensor